MEKIAQTLRKWLHAAVEPSPSNAARALPLFLKNVFETQVFRVEDIDVLFARPREQMSFSALGKQWRQLEQYAKAQCVLCLDETTRYAKERLVELEIPFILGEDNLYLPFLGVALRKKRKATPPRITKLTPIAQKMVLLALYEKWRRVSSREISEKMGVSRMTASRNLLELQALNLPLVETVQNAKYFSFEGSRRELFEMCNPFFDNPAAKTYILEEIPHGLDCLAGRSALSRSSLLSDNAYRTYGLTREECRELGIADYPECDPEDAVCVIHVLRYKIKMDKTIDPISAALCVSELEPLDIRDKAMMRRILDEVLRD